MPGQMSVDWVAGWCGIRTVPLTPDERAIAEGDLEKLESLIRKLDNVPALDGRMPRRSMRERGGYK